MNHFSSEGRDRLENLKSLVQKREEPVTTASCILESLPTPVVALARAGDLTIFNKAATTLFEIEPDHAVGQSPEEVFSVACAHTFRKIARRSTEFCVVSQATLTHAGRDYAVLAAPYMHNGVVAGAIIVIGPSIPSAPARDLTPFRAANGGGYWVPVFIPTQDEISDASSYF